MILVVLVWSEVSRAGVEEGGDSLVIEAAGDKLLLLYGSTVVCVKLIKHCISSLHSGLLTIERVSLCPRTDDYIKTAEKRTDTGEIVPSSFSVNKLHGQ